CRNARGVAMPPNRDSFCPHFQTAIELIGRRWSGTILRALMDGPLRFSEISTRIPEISDRSLSLRLKELENESVTVRLVEATQPVSVSYKLTDKGRDLEVVIAEVERWAHDWVAPPETSNHGRPRPDLRPDEGLRTSL
ncbi:MAG: winged helix-turn-helix transcriptional regulator, partial [Actinomycetota bacterium]